MQELRSLDFRRREVTRWLLHSFLEAQEKDSIVRRAGEGGGFAFQPGVSCGPVADPQPGQVVQQDDVRRTIRSDASVTVRSVEGVRKSAFEEVTPDDAFLCARPDFSWERDGGTELAPGAGPSNSLLKRSASPRSARRGASVGSNSASRRRPATARP